MIKIPDQIIDNNKQPWVPRWLFKMLCYFFRDCAVCGTEGKALDGEIICGNCLEDTLYASNDDEVSVSGAPYKVPRSSIGGSDD